MVLEVSQLGKPTHFVIGLYNNSPIAPQPEGPTTIHRIIANQPLQQLLTHPSIIAGDWNLHHPRWDSFATQSRDADEGSG